ncbi:MAG: 50S ribosomal protein L21e [archaeon]|nr:50S ribosomal protein L21e [archaeon]
MAKGKSPREKGKLKFSRYFKKIDEGSKVAVVRDFGVTGSFPKRIQGREGKVLSSRGKAKLVEIMDGNKRKTFIIHPIHLKNL